jgi:putative transcriptional regulator
MIHHHPGEDLLLAYAAGAADEALSLIVATHMTYCAICRLRGKKLESLGGALLQELPPAALDAGALDNVLARLDAVTPYERPRRAASREARLRRCAPISAAISAPCAGARWARACPMRRCSSAAM